MKLGVALRALSLYYYYLLSEREKSDTWVTLLGGRSGCSREICTELTSTSTWYGFLDETRRSER